jgi:hypothetical protein
MPTPTPRPPDISADDLIAACDGTPVAKAARYAGALHPLVAVQGGGLDEFGWWGDEPPINAKWVHNEWPSPIQLVLCVDVNVDQSQHADVIDSCGSFTRQDGVSGEVDLARRFVPIRVIVARTGKVLQSETFYGSIPTCQTSYNFFGDSQGPPWMVTGGEVSVDTVDAYAVSVSKQKVK